MLKTVCGHSPNTFVEFAASEPVPGFNDGTLQLAFSDLRQVSWFSTECVYVLCDILYKVKKQLVLIVLLSFLYSWRVVW